MGQGANARRNATLDEKKLRSAGRQQEPRKKLNMRDHGPAKPVAGAGASANKSRRK